jgi:hypothetical protein
LFAGSNLVSSLVSAIDHPTDLKKGLRHDLLAGRPYSAKISHFRGLVMNCRVAFKSLTLLLLLSLFLPAIASGQAVSFNQNTIGQNIIAHADFNNDGREDFVVTAPGNSSQFGIMLSSGDNFSYQPVVYYTLPSGSPEYFAIGDFKADGNLDLIVSNGTKNFYEYLNNGKGALHLQGTWQTNVEVDALAAADVNHDGNIDLLFASSTDNSLHVYTGNPDGGFNVGPATPMSVLGRIYIGDFDGDGKADVYSVDNNYGSTNQILYGDGTGHFTPAPSFGEDAFFVPYDLNGDGRMDLVGAPFDFSINGSKYYNLVRVYYGNANRTFTKRDITLANCTGLGGFPPIVADFNGDGINDMAIAEAADCQGNGPFTMNMLLGNSDGSYQHEQVLFSSTFQIYPVDTIRIDRDSKPDFAVTYAYSPINSELFVNTTPGGFPSCSPPNSATGITLCAPTSSVDPSSPVTFRVGASNQTSGRKVEVWVDGKKMSEQLKHTFSYYSFLDASYNLAAGQHNVTVFSAGWDNLLERYDFPLSVGTSSCPLPTSPGLNVCSPLSNSTLGTTVQALASGKVTGTIARMEVWVDGVKKYSTYGSPTLNTSLTLTSGPHKFDFYIANTTGNLWEYTKYATVQ